MEGQQVKQIPPMWRVFLLTANRDENFEKIHFSRLSTIRHRRVHYVVKNLHLTRNVCLLFRVRSNF